MAAIAIRSSALCLSWQTDVKSVEAAHEAPLQAAKAKIIVDRLVFQVAAALFNVSGASSNPDRVDAMRDYGIPQSDPLQGSLHR